MHTKRLRPAYAGVAAIFAFSVSAHADITVGIVTSLTGPNASLGTLYQKGLAIAPAEVAGEKIKTIILDDASDPSTGVKNARKLIYDDKVDVILGPSNTPIGFAVAGVTLEEKVPQISFSPIDLFDDKAAWLTSVPQPAEIWIVPLIKDMQKKGLKRVAFIGFTDKWGDICFDALKSVGGKAGIEIVADERYARTDTSVQGQILKILAKKPDGIFVGGSGSPGALPHLALAERNYAGPVYETPAIFNRDFIRLGGTAIEGVLAATGPNVVMDQLPDSNPIKAVSLDFRKRYEAANGPGSANSLAAYGYDAYLIFEDAAKRALKRAKPGTTEFRTALREEIVAVKELAGTHGIYSFKKGTPYGVDERSSVIVRFEKGEWKLVP